MTFPNLTIIGERINPGFKSTKERFENDDFAGISALAKRQADAGAAYLNINCGRRSKDDPEFLVEVIRTVQAATDVPLCFDFPNVEVQENCLKTYDIEKVKGRKPIVNSIAETRWDILGLAKICPFRVILMASERMEDGRGKPNKHAREVFDTAHRMICGVLNGGYGFSKEDLIIDVSVSAVAADTEGLTQMAIEAIRAIGQDVDLKGISIMGRLSNISQQMPSLTAHGSNLQMQLENAFLTIAHPLGFDTILGTPWKDYQPLVDGNCVLQTFCEVLDQRGMAALRSIRKYYKAA